MKGLSGRFETDLEFMGIRTVVMGYKSYGEVAGGTYHKGDNRP